ncbi:MAG: DsrE family protein [Betaproteobacteria bacterium]|nr:DsrE family protein [Betaproteobacteria bacterium]
MAEVDSAARCVWDFTTGDARRFCDRLALVIDTGEDFQKRGIACDFVLLLHGAATQFGARTLSGTKFDKPDAADLAPAHALLRRFARMGGRIVVCGIAMERSAIAEDNLFDGATIERNVFVSSVALQNQGYAYMPIA